jgi:hypothetical protein
VFQARNRYNLAGPPPDNAWYALKKSPDCLPPELLEVLRLNKPDDEKNPSLKIGYPDYRGSYPKAPINARGFFSTQTYDPGTPANWPPRDCQHQKAAEGIAKLSAPPAQIVRETWKGAILTWTPGNQLITAVFRERKATVSGKDLVPEALHNSLFGRRKAKATVTVEKLGNAFRIVNIEAE